MHSRIILGLRLTRLGINHPELIHQMQLGARKWWGKFCDYMFSNHQFWAWKPVISYNFCVELLPRKMWGRLVLWLAAWNKWSSTRVSGGSVLLVPFSWGVVKWWTKNLVESNPEREQGEIYLIETPGALDNTGGGMQLQNLTRDRPPTLRGSKGKFTLLKHPVH